MIGVTMWGRISNPTHTRTRRAGWVGRQLGYARNGSPLQPFEIEHIHAAGLGLAVIFLPDVSTFFAGHDQGAEDAIEMFTHAYNLGMPKDVPIFVWVPFHPDPAEAGFVGNYLAGWAENQGDGVFGVAGIRPVIEAARAAGHGAFTWHLYPYPTDTTATGAHLRHCPELDALPYGGQTAHNVTQGTHGLWTPPGVDLTNLAGI